MTLSRYQFGYETYFIFQGELLCFDCGRKLREEIKEEATPEELETDIWLMDSDSYPVAHSMMNSEWDYPCHCSQCSEFIETANLTDAGVAYVKEVVKTHPDNDISELYEYYYSDIL